MTNFQIAVYQPNNPDQFNTLTPLAALNPFAISYGPFVLNWYSIYEPRNVVHTPPQAVGQDTGGFPSVRGFAKMEWQYMAIKPDNWYFLYYLWRLAQRPAGKQTGAVRIQWPDPTTGQNQTISARWDAITSVDRDVAMFHDLSLTFTHLGIDDPQSAIIGTWMVG